MEYDKTIGNIGRFEVQVYDAELDEQEPFIKSVVLVLGDDEKIVELDEPVKSGEVIDTIKDKLVEDTILRRIKEDKLVDINRDEKLSVDPDTKIFKTLLVIAYLQPISTDVVGEVLEYKNPRSMVGNAIYRDLIQPVGENGNKHYYSLTPEGWKQIIAVHGWNGWKDTAKELIAGYRDETEEYDEEQSGLAAFGYEEDS